MRIMLLVACMALIVGCGAGVTDPNAGQTAPSARQTCRDLNLNEVRIETIFRVFVSEEGSDESLTLQFDAALPQCAPENMDDCVETTGNTRDRCVAECLGCVAAVASEAFTR